MRFFIFFSIIILVSGCRSKVPKLSEKSYRNIYDSSQLDSMWTNTQLQIDTNQIDKTGFLVYPDNEYLAAVRWNKQIDEPLRVQTKEDLKVIYHRRAYQPIWLERRRSSKFCKVFLNHISQAKNHGLEKEAYDFSSLAREISDYQSGTLNYEEISILELNMTKVYLLMSNHLMYGETRPHATEEGQWLHNDDTKYKLINLAAVHSPRNLKAFYQELIPNAFQYETMMGYLSLYRKMADEYQWEPITLGYNEIVEIGDTNSIVPAVRTRLQTLNTLVGKSNELNDHVYDQQLYESLKLFQQQHGLVDDGVIGSTTISALNVSFEQLAEIIKLNMERIRWLPAKKFPHKIWINIPSYSLALMEGDKQIFDTKVIIGQDTTATPIFTDTLKYLVFSPTWVIPNSIKAKEMLPKLKNNPEYYPNTQYKFYEGWSSNEEDEVNPTEIDWNQYTEENFPFNVIQQPGESNSLGRVKFIMPNDLSIYLHDTPAEEKFNYNQRAFSHGCIRVEEPVKLASLLLNDNKDWDARAISKAMNAEEPKTVYFDKGMPVQITYFTAFISENGVLNFRRDLYGFDDLQLNYLTNKNY